MKQLPYNLQGLELIIGNNKLGGNFNDDIKYLGEGIKQLSNNL